LKSRKALSNTLLRDLKTKSLVRFGLTALEASSQPPLCLPEYSYLCQQNESSCDQRRLCVEHDHDLVAAHSVLDIQPMCWAICYVRLQK